MINLQLKRGKTGKLSLTLTGSSNRLLEGSSNRPASTRSTFRTKIYKRVRTSNSRGKCPEKYYTIVSLIILVKIIKCHQRVGGPATNPEVKKSSFQWPGAQLRDWLGHTLSKLGRLRLVAVPRTGCN